MRARDIICALILLLGGFGAPGFAQTPIERLVNPGPLAKAHATLEAKCEACHVAFSPSAEAGQCLACHAPVAADIRNKRGLHGKAIALRGAAAGQGCRECHTEHKGRAFAITRINPASFDHRQTDFVIRGAHRAVTCSACHRGKAPFRAAPSTCIGCHADDDVHRTRLGTACATCHSETAWKPIRAFDHSGTGFALTGAHQTTRCSACHVAEVWKGAPRTCVGCHKDDDIHKDSRGTNCGQCHGTTAWKGAVFDHDTATRFPLIGRHQRVTCAGCHGGAGKPARPKPATECQACHQTDDVHKGRFGPGCATCHSPAGWKLTSFDHGKVARFPLLGAHARIACEACHVAPVAARAPPTTCVGCHAAVEPHRGVLGKACGSCHGAESWTTGMRFDHGLTRLPLFGRHAAINCRQCHADKTFRAAGIACIDCHADKWHAGRLGARPDCAVCHQPTAWRGGRFDHDKQTGFALIGPHRRLDCHACHARPAATARLRVDCLACHAGDDIHEGRFGRNCGSCHVGDTFKTVRLPAPAPPGGRR